jgi:rhodanese-related sulfurtransferase
MQTRRWFLLLIVFVSSLGILQLSRGLTAAAADQGAPPFRTIAQAQLAQMLARKDFLFVNVHVPYDGEIERTDLFIPFDHIADNLDKLPSDKNANIVLYCRSGRMSEIAAGTLSKLGYTSVSYLAGGMIQWRDGGHEVVTKER